MQVKTIKEKDLLSEDQEINEKINHPTWHLFVIWNNSLYKKNEILMDIEKKFLIREAFEISWSPDLFENNLRRFYGANLPNPKEKTQQCGYGPFSVFLVIDPHPRYGKRGTNYGKQLVNTNIFDSKMQYRKWLGGGFPVHGSTTEKETNHDLTLLLGKNLNDVIKTLPTTWNNQIRKLNRDLTGCNGWENISELFYVLNATTNYVILRNFESFPDSLSEEHKDIDILTDDLWQIPYIVNKKIRSDDEDGPSSYVKIMNRKIKLDFRYPGDYYYDEGWEKEILKRRVLSNHGFYIPDPENHFYTLLYHMLIHKGKVTQDYLKRLEGLSYTLKLEVGKLSLNDFVSLKQILDNFMRKKGYRYTNSLMYKLMHNEFTRLLKSAVFIGRKQGLGKLVKAGKGKLYRRKLIKSGQI